MCEPMTIMAAVAVGTTLMSTAIQAKSQADQAKAQNAAAEYQAQVHEANAQQAAMMAADARERGEIEANEHRGKTSALVGKQRTIAGAAGLSLSGGTPLDVFEETAQTGEYDAQKILNNAEREAYGHEGTQRNQTASAGLKRGQKKDPSLEIAGTVLGGIGQAAGQWYRMS